MKPALSYLRSATCAVGVALAMLAGHVHAQQVPIPQTAAEVRGPAPGPMTKAYVRMLQVLLPAASGEGEPAPLDGKVIAISEDDGPRTALVRFTGIDWDTRDRVEAYARRAREQVAAAAVGLSARPSAEPGGQAAGLP